MEVYAASSIIHPYFDILIIYDFLVKQISLIYLLNPLRCDLLLPKKKENIIIFFHGLYPGQDWKCKTSPIISFCLKWFFTLLCIF